MQVIAVGFNQRWTLPLVLGAIVLLIMLGGDSVTQWLQYDREAIAHGQLWRVITAHVTHLGWPHMLLNLAGLFLLWFLLGDVMSDANWLLLLLVSALSISAGLLLFDPQLYWYVGLSGVLHGILLGGALLRAADGNLEGVYLLVITVGKLAWEQIVGPMPGSEATAGGTVIVDAHLYGAIAGAVYCLLLLAWRRRKLVV